METNNTVKTYQFLSKNALMMSYNTEFFLCILTDISNISTVMGRKYLKIQTVMANVGGFIKFVMLFICSFNNFITRFLFLEKIYLKSYTKYNQFYKKISSEKNIKRALSYDQRKLDENKNINNPIKLQSILNEKEKNLINRFDTNSNNITDSHILKQNFMKKEEKKLIEYKELSFSSFVCCSKGKKEFQTLKVLDINFICQINIVKLFYLFKKSNLTEKLIFGSIGKKWKFFLVHNDISEIEINFKNLKEKEEILKSLKLLKNFPRILDINKILVHEIDKKMKIQTTE